MPKTVHDLIVWDREGVATLPPEAQDEVPCDNPFDWAPVQASTIEPEKED